MQSSFTVLTAEKQLHSFGINTSDKGVQLNVNNIIRIVNQIGPNDERLKEVFAKRDRAAHQETENSGRRKRFEPFKTLGRYKVFQAQTYIETANLKTEDAFRKAAGYIYSWVKCPLLRGLF